MARFMFLACGLVLAAIPAARSQDETKREFVIPQDPERIKLMRAKRLKEAQAVTIDEFKAYGNQNAPWSKVAAECLQMCAIMNSRRHGISAYNGEDVLAQQLADSAIAMQCDDPTLLYNFRTENNLGFKGGHLDYCLESVRIHNQFVKKKYSPQRIMVSAFKTYCDCQIFQNKYEKNAARKSIANIEQYRDQFLDYAGIVAAERYRVTEQIIAGMGDSMSALEPAETWALYTSLQDKIAKNGGSEWVKKYLEGRFHIAYAWQARGGKTIDKVSEENIKLFHERCAVAEAALKAAWAADPSHGGPARFLVSVSRGTQMPEEEVELWFRRAMEYDPDDTRAIQYMSEALHPKWGGDAKRRQEFFDAAIKTKNYYSGIPLISLPSVNGDIPYATEWVFDAFVQPRFEKDVKEVILPFLEVNPKNDPILIRLAAAYFVRDEPKQGLEIYKRISPSKQNSMIGGRSLFQMKKEAEDKLKSPGKPPP
jgi:hypothetical protein